MPSFSHLYSSALDRELATDDSTVLFLTGRRKDAINEGLQEFAEQTGCAERRLTLTVTSTAAEYDLNSTALITDGDFAALSKTPIAFRYTNASSVVTVLAGRDDLPMRSEGWLHDYEPGWQVSTVADGVEQLPQMTYLRQAGSAQLLGFWPAPSSGSSASMSADVTYLSVPAVLTSDTQEPYQVSSGLRRDLRPYHQAAVHWGAHQLEKLRRDDQASDRQLQKFLGYVARFLQAHRIKGGTHVTTSRAYFTSRGVDRGSDPRR